MLEEWDRSELSGQVAIASSQVVYNGLKREIRIYPLPPFEAEIIVHQFKPLGIGKRPGIRMMTLIDLVHDKAGLLFLPWKDSLQFSGAPKPHFRTDLELWSKQGCPSSAEFCVGRSASGAWEMVRATITREEPGTQFVWHLKLDYLATSSSITDAHNADDLESPHLSELHVGSDPASYTHATIGAEGHKTFYLETAIEAYQAAHGSRIGYHASANDTTDSE